MWESAGRGRERDVGECRTGEREGCGRVKDGGERDVGEWGESEGCGRVRDVGE